MIEAVISAGAGIIVGVLALVGVIITNNRSNDKLNSEIQHKLETFQAVTDTKLEELTREVRKHNNFAERMPAVEQKIEDMNKVVDKLQGFHMQ